MNLPLFLTYRGTTIGNGFVAQIEARMKILAERTQDGIVLWSVVPGDVVAEGVDLDAAHGALRALLRQQFVEIAKAHSKFEDFRRAAMTFCASVDDAKLNEWSAAVEEIRKKEDVSALGIPVVKAETGTFCEVVPKDAAELTPDLNEPPATRPLSGVAHVQLASAA